MTDVLVTYLVDRYYDAPDEFGVAWNDPEIGIDWGIGDPVLSARDGANQRRSEILAALVPLAPPATAH